MSYYKIHKRPKYDTDYTGSASAGYKGSASKYGKHHLGYHEADANAYYDGYSAGGGVSSSVSAYKYKDEKNDYNLSVGKVGAYASGSTIGGGCGAYANAVDGNYGAYSGKVGVEKGASYGYKDYTVHVCLYEHETFGDTHCVYGTTSI